VESDYKLLIYDRWGKMVFQTDDRGEGWDGRIDGNPAEQGVYTWIIFYTDGLGSHLESNNAKGVVLLMR
jgi:gliding motility-associated-like protein